MMHCLSKISNNENSKFHKRRAIVLAAFVTALIAPFALLGSVNAQEENWDDLVAKAKEEGTVTVWAEAGNSRVAFLKGAFEAAYPGVSVDLFQAPNTGDRDSRLLRELEAKVAKVDVFVGGGGGAAARLKPAGALQPLKPMLLPEIIDASNWSTESQWFDLEGEYIFASDALAFPPVVANASVDISSLQSWTELLDAKYDGKIVMGDPRQPGLSRAVALFLYKTPGLGPDYLQKLFANKRVVFSRDERQNIEWIASGRMLIGIGPRPSEILELQKIGGDIQPISSLLVDGQSWAYRTGTDGVIFIPNVDPLPHPNATKLYVNWFLSQQGQTALVANMLTSSLRVDVPPTGVPEVYQIQPGTSYLNLNDENLTAGGSFGKIGDIVSEIYGGAN